jgi:hypothetical protein
MVRRGVARGSFHLVAEVVPGERLLLLSSRPGPSPPGAAAAFETGSVDRIVWNHSRVSVSAGVGGGALLSLPVGHHGVDGAYAFQVLPGLARSQPNLVLGAVGVEA